MKTRNITSRARLGTALTALALGLTAVAVAAPAEAAQPKAYKSGSYRPTSHVELSVGEGQMINLPRSVASVWTSNPKVADVYVNSARQINLFGKEDGEATVIATGLLVQRGDQTFFRTRLGDLLKGAHTHRATTR